MIKYFPNPITSWSAARDFDLRRENKEKGDNVICRGKDKSDLVVRDNKTRRNWELFSWDKNLEGKRVAASNLPQNGTTLLLLKSETQFHWKWFAHKNKDLTESKKIIKAIEITVEEN